MWQKCPECGKSFDPKGGKYKICYDCFQKQKKQAGGGGSGSSKSRKGRGAQLPEECVFDTFYKDGHLRRGIFVEAAEKMAGILSRQKMTATSIRNLFNMLKPVANRLKAEPDADFGLAQTQAYEFYRQVQYMRKRGVIASDVFVEFVRRHLDLMTSKQKEFFGFVEYLTSIMAYVKQK
ncbi:MAG: type III-A CRISPR-associated protein Csm2 [bacterium]